MSETLTVDPTPEAEVAGEVEGVQLTAEEQDSLAVGEQITEAQDNLLAGKYENAQELEKAYIELQKKLGEDGKEETPEAEDQNESEEVLQEEPEESSKELSPAAQLINSATEEYDSNDGKLTPETLEKFSAMSSQELVEAYMQVQASQPDQPDQTSTDISDAMVNEVKNFVGGEKAYGDMIQWAGENLEQNAIQAFDNIVNSGSLDAIKLAVNGLKAQYQNAVGYEGEMITGKAPTSTKDVYRSQAELVAAMSDRRYDDDPAYRQDVIAKLERSDNLQF